MADDFVKEVVRVVLAAARAPEDRMLQWQAELAVRRMWGGERRYIGKAPDEGKVERLATGLAAGVPLRTAFDAAGVSERHGFRLLSRRWPLR